MRTATLAAYGILLYGGQFSFLFSAIHTGLTAGLASLILQLQAFFTIGLALIIFRETPTRAQIAGAVVSSLGIVVVGMHVGGGDVTLPGLVLAIIAALCWSGGNLITKSFGKVDMFAVVVWGNMFAGIVLAALAAVIEGPEVMVRSVADIHMPTALSLAYIAYISTFVGYTLWSRMLSHHPAAVVAPFTLLVPPFAMVSASLLLGEAYPLWKFEATALILCGLAINQFGGKLRARILKMLVRNPV